MHREAEGEDSAISNAEQYATHYREALEELEKLHGTGSL